MMGGANSQAGLDMNSLQMMTMMQNQQAMAMGGMNPYMGLGMGMGMGMGMPFNPLSTVSNAAQFHQPAEKN